jgi:uncharacterized protein YecT (DUF1311 family)
MSGGTSGRLLALLALLGVSAGTSAAAQDLPFDIRATESCVAAAPDPRAQRTCIGASATECMATPAGSSTYGMGGCLDAELTWWDDRLNQVYRDLRARDARDDAANQGLPGAASQAEALRDMQRAWIAFRDASCHYERVQWGGGTGGGPAALDCLMRMTAEQAIFLEEAMGW